MTTPLRIDTLDGGLRIAGELDASNARHVAERLEELDPSTDVVLDLTELDFIDSAGVNLLITLARDLREEVRMVLRCRPEGPVRRVIDLMGIADALDRVVLEDVPGSAPPVGAEEGAPGR